MKKRELEQSIKNYANEIRISHVRYVNFCLMWMGLYQRLTATTLPFDFYLCVCDADIKSKSRTVLDNIETG